MSEVPRVYLKRTNTFIIRIRLWGWEEEEGGSEGLS